MTTPPLLLIEDTPSLQLVYQSVLRGAGHEVLTEGTAEGGMRSFRESGTGIVLLDLTLPDRDGLDLMADMLALRPETVVI
ncbi:response regulator, partial [Thioclava sp. BHET1]